MWSPLRAVDASGWKVDIAATAEMSIPIGCASTIK